MNAIELLTTQHDEVDELIARIQNSTDDQVKGAALLELADKFAAHSTIEEKLFYPAAMTKQTEDMLLEAAEEHLALKRVLADMLELGIDHEQFKPKLSVMKEGIEHHAREEEEGKLFPRVQKLLDAEELEALGSEMLSMFETLLQGSPRKNVPAETAHAAVLPAP
jgi:hypothetical protein